MSDPIILDNGSASIKAGVAGDDAPRAQFSTSIGLRRRPGVMPYCIHDSYIGDQLQRNRGICAIHYPIERGIVKNWDAMQMIWHHLFYSELRIEPRDHPVVLSEPILNPKINREKMTEMMFETFEVPSILMALAPVLSIYSHGRVTGLVVECGDGLTQIAPIVNGYLIPHGVIRLEFGGRDLTEYLKRMLTERGVMMSTSAEFEIAREMKENLCYSALDYENDMTDFMNSTMLHKNYELPDGQVITLGNERIRAAEALFDPSLIGREHGGIQHCINESLNLCQYDLKKDLMKAILLTGGASTVPGFLDRMQKELRNFLPQDKLAIVAAPERNVSAWIGGSIIGSMGGGVRDMTKYEYDEYGPAFVHKKFTLI